MKLQKVLLICGVLASLVYVGTDLLAATFHDGYHSFAAQTISELDARGAPTRAMVTPLLILYDVLVVAFGAGVWMAAGGGRARQVTAVTLIAIGVIGLPGPWLFPMNLRGVGGDVPHIVATAAMVLLIVTGMVFGAFALGRRFRAYSFATIVVTAAFGALTSLQAQGLVTGEPTPWIGIAERLCIGAFLLWGAVLAVGLLREERADTTKPAHRGWVVDAATARG